MTMKISENRLGSMPIKELLLKTSLPLILSLLIQVLYGLVDSLYVAHISNEALTAISLCTPVQYLITGIGAGIGVGTNALLSRQLGADSKSMISKVIGNGLLLVWLASVVMLVVGSICILPFFRCQTDIPNIVSMCNSYSRILCVAALASFHQVFFERLLSSTGKTNLTMLSMMIGTIVNIILDPIMIFGWLGVPAMGMAGAAYATVIAQVIACFVGLYLNVSRNKKLKFEVSELKFDIKLIKEILNIGIPVTITNCMISILTFGMNNILLPLSVVAPAVYIACIRLQSFAIMPANGISDANVSIIAYNLGAGNNKRIKETLKVGISADIIVSIIVTVIFLAIPKQLLQLFNASEEMIRIGIPALRIIGLGIPFLGISNILRGCLQALGRGKESFLLSIAQAVLLIGGAWIFAQTGKITFVWISFPLMELLRAILASVFVQHSLKEVFTKK